MWCICAKDPATGEVFSYGPDQLVEGYQKLQSARQIVGHNVRMYDDLVLERLVGRPNGLGPLPPSIDTLLVSRLIYPDRFGNPVKGHRLRDWGVYLGILKGEFDDWSKFTPEMLRYCKQDVELGTRIFLHQLPFIRQLPRAVRLEHQVASIAALQVLNGVGADVAQIEELLKEVSLRRLDVEARLAAIFPSDWEEMKTPQYWVTCDGHRYGRKSDIPARLKHCAEPGPLRRKEIPFNPGSGQQIAERLIRQGWKPDKQTASGQAATDESVLRGLEGKYEGVAELLEFTLVKKRQEQAMAWLEAVTPEGRIHGSVITNGTNTGRWTHSNPNMAQVPKVGKPLGEECRRCFGPRKGWVQVGCDASGLEARMLAHYMGRWDGGAFAEIVTTGDIHSHNQALAGLDNRDQAKTLYYAFLYGGGDAKLGTIVNGGAAQGTKLRARFLKNLPALASLLDWIEFEVRSKKRLVGLDGRILPIRHHHAALNLLLQSAGAVLMKAALVALKGALDAKGWEHGRDYAFMLNIHDEWQMECKPEIAEELGMAACMAIEFAGVELGIQCPLAGEYKIGRNWAETH